MKIAIPLSLAVLGLLTLTVSVGWAIAILGFAFLTCLAVSDA